MTNTTTPLEKGGADKILGLREAERANSEQLLGWVMGLLPPAVQPVKSADALTDLKAALRIAYQHYQIFDADHYRETYLRKDSKNDQATDPFDDYMENGRYKAYAPNPFFDAVQYISDHADVSDICLDACLHFMFYGWKEDRSSGTRFDARGYLEGNPDVAEAGLNPFQHFLLSGRHEGRTPNGKSTLQNELDQLAQNELTAGALNYGTLLFVSHDANVGGAQEVVRNIANWVKSHTAYDVRFVTMKPGGMLHKFQDIAPTFVLDDEKGGDLPLEDLEKFCGPNVRAVFLNSIASGSFVNHWTGDAPTIAYVHELPRMLAEHTEELDLLRKHAAKIIGGSEAVRAALRDQFTVADDLLDMVHGFLGQVEGLEDIAQRDAAKRAIGVPPEKLIVSACGVVHWRKSPELFIDVADKVRAKTQKDVHFIWAGGGPDEEKCRALIDAKGLKDAVTITGYTPEPQTYIDACDVFLLPSEEDPFPLVCLMAGLAQAPIVCFEGAGGMPELVQDGCGTVVPFLDAHAMADATLRYLDNTDLRLQHGAQGRSLVKARHTIETAGPQLFSIIQNTADLRPVVSVVVPNYNYEAYLPERLASIAAQTFQDFEVILIDDASTDASVNVMRDWAKTRDNARVIVNDTNSGSPFKQWIKGMELARADLIWIAEADDFCDPNLLASLVPAFEDRNTFLAYVKSVPVNADGEIQGDYEGPYLNRIADGRWSQDYDVTDHQEANLGLGIANCIPNASAVMLRKFKPEPEFETRVTSMRMCGDWYYYLRAMRGGRVAYRTTSANFHRRHASTVTAQTEGSPLYFEELQTVRDDVQQTYRLGRDARDRIEQFVTEDLDRFGILDQNKRNSIVTAATRSPAQKRLPTVLFVVSDLAPGGGQMFAVRMANAWSDMGGRAVLGNVGYLPTHPQVASQISPRVALIQQFDAASNSLKAVCKAYDIDLIHSSLWWADAFVAQNGIGDMDDIPWITTMHGCHESILIEPKIDERFPDFMGFMRTRIDAWVPIAEKNRQVFDTFGLPETVRHIPNGAPISRNKVLTRADLGLREDAVVLCLASRAIEAKGWFAAVEIVQTLNAEGHAVDLMLIGEGPAKDQLTDQDLPHVHLYGHRADIHDYMAVCDIGILPSFFVGESMPLVLLELMGLGKPIAATDAGEIAFVLGHGSAGVIVPLGGDDTLDVPRFHDALRGLVTSEDDRARIGAAALKRYEEKFTIEQMMECYRSLYADVLNRRSKQASAAE